MAVEIFLSITDLTDDKGAPRPGSVVIDSVAYVQISDFSFSVTSDVVSTGAAAGKTQVELNPLVVTLPVDFLTPLLLVSVAQGTTYPRAILIVRDGGPNPVTTEQYEFQEVAVRSLSVAGSPGGDQQTAALGYGAFQVTATPVTAQGQAGAPTTAGFNITTNRAS